MQAFVCKAIDTEVHFIHCIGFFKDQKQIWQPLQRLEMLSENRGKSQFSWSTILRVVNNWSNYRVSTLGKLVIMWQLAHLDVVLLVFKHSALQFLYKKNKSLAVTCVTSQVETCIISHTDTCVIYQIFLFPTIRLLNFFRKDPCFVWSS